MSPNERKRYVADCFLFTHSTRQGCFPFNSCNSKTPGSREVGQLLKFEILSWKTWGHREMKDRYLRLTAYFNFKLNFDFVNDTTLLANQH